MYQSFYRLVESPFELKCDPRFVFYTARHREALTSLENTLVAKSPLTLLLGGAGTGKTTLLRSSLKSRRCSHIRRLHLTNPALMRQGLFDALFAEFRPDAHTASPAATPLETLRAMLRDRRSQGVTHALIIDEAETL